MPELVVYADGRVIASRDKPSGQTLTRSVVEAQLQPGDVCTLLAQIEIDGFFKDDTAIYVPPGVTDMGTTHVTVRGWLSQTVSAYGLDVALSKEHGPVGAAYAPGLARTYRRLRDYQLRRAKPYQPERVAVRISSFQSDQAAPLWPLSDPRLTDLSSRTGDIVLEGKQAVEVYKLFGSHLSQSYVEKGKAYRVTVRPLLPLEQWGSRGWGRGPYAYPLAPMVELTCGFASSGGL